MHDFFARLAASLNLGCLASSPEALSGGFLHRMFSLRTTSGHYAVKLLNPHIMARPGAMENFRQAQALEALLESKPIPILPALCFHGHRLQELDGQYCYVYPFYPGSALSPDEVTPEHCAIIARHLAHIHAVDSRPCAESVPDAPQIDWESYLSPLAERHPELHTRLVTALPVLWELQASALTAIPRLPKLSGICHNDMDCKNVLWQGMDCRIIDLECLAYGNPHQELFDLALTWSGMDSGNPDVRRLDAFLCSYRQSGGTLPQDWETLYHARTGPLFWLEYNLRRCLGMDGSSKEIPLGLSQSLTTLDQILCYYSLKPQLLSYLGKIPHS